VDATGHHPVITIESMGIFPSETCNFTASVTVALEFLPWKKTQGIRGVNSVIKLHKMDICNLG
jgi:hypothetical protein